MRAGKTQTLEVYSTDHSKFPNVQKNKERHTCMVGNHDFIDNVLINKYHREDTTREVDGPYKE